MNRHKLSKLGPLLHMGIAFMILSQNMRKAITTYPQDDAVRTILELRLVENELAIDMVREMLRKEIG